MGNVGLERALDAFTAVHRREPNREHRFRIEHATLASGTQVRQLAELGAVAVVQPGFVEMLGSRIKDLHFEDATWMPFAELARAGVPLAGSSDDPCSPCHPLLASRLGVTRTTRDGAVVAGDQRVSYEEWLRAWTIGSAYAGGQEDERGTLVPGKRADPVVLEGELDAEARPAVHETWVAGQRLHPSPGRPDPLTGQATVSG